jgi:hypothetical protein
MKLKLEQLLNTQLDLMQRGLDEEIRLSAQELGSVTKLYAIIVDMERRSREDTVAELSKLSDAELAEKARRLLES